jgi:phospholipase/lecithinase/hemolysin
MLTWPCQNFSLFFTPDKLFSNRIVLNITWANQGTAEGGPNWVEHLTNCGTQKGLTDPRACPRQLWDFAYAGANTVSEPGFTPAHWNHTVSFQQQTEQFVSYGNPALESIGLSKKDALVAIWIGINDINDLAKLRGKNVSFTPLYEKVEGYVWANVEKIYALGYRKYLVMNLPPLNRSPSPAVNASMIQTFNGIAARHAEEFAARHKDAMVLQYDVNAVLNGILDNYQDYGFQNVTNFCPGYNKADIRVNPGKYGCGEGLDTYFWYDSGHLGSRTHKVFSGMLEKWLVERSGKN